MFRSKIPVGRYVIKHEFTADNRTTKDITIKS